MTETLAHDVLNDVPGGPDLMAWFGGRVPSFHDAEVVEVALERIRSRCRIKVHTFQPTPDLDARGHFICVKHVVVTFELSEVSELELTDFNHQNVVDGIGFTRLPNGRIRLMLEPCYGIWGEIEAGSMQISLEPGMPPDSIYRSQSVPA